MTGACIASARHCVLAALAIANGLLAAQAYGPDAVATFTDKIAISGFFHRSSVMFVCRLHG